jgi:hypothetical protein
MKSTLNLNDFWEKIVFSENHDLEHKVYILNEFCSKIRKEFFKNNFMPFLKDLLKLNQEIQKVSTTSVINVSGKKLKIIDHSDDSILELIEISKEMIKELLIEGSKRWNVLLEMVNFMPDKEYGTIKIELPNDTMCFYLNYVIKDGKKFIMFKDLNCDSIEEWTWNIKWDYEIPKETLKYILKEKINDSII